MPVRPFARLDMFMRAAKRTRLSPAGPICSTSIFGSPSSFLIVLSASPVTFPHKGEASRSSASPLWIHRYTGSGALPLIMRASKPANFNSAGQYPPHCESPMAFVRGDLALAVMRLCPEIGAPVVTPTLRAKMFSGLKGSTRGGISFRR